MNGYMVAGRVARLEIRIECKLSFELASKEIRKSMSEWDKSFPGIEWSQIVARS